MIVSAKSVAILFVSSPSRIN